MAENTREPEPVSEFLRVLIEQWEKSGRRLYELAAEAKLAKSMPSQIKAKTSDASFYSAAKLAKPLGYRGLPELVSAAYAWWQSSDRSKVPEGDATPQRSEAIARALEYGMTREQIERALTRYPIDQFGDRDALWWLSRFHEERSLDVKIGGLQGAADHLEEWGAKQDKKKARAEWRGRTAAKKGSKAKSDAAEPRRRKATG